MGLFTTGAMAAGTLYTYPENFRAYKALIAAQYSGAKVTVAPDFKFGETNKTDAFLKKFPLGKVPAFEGTDGTWLFESNAIAYFVANRSRRNSSPRRLSPRLMQRKRPLPRNPRTPLLSCQLVTLSWTTGRKCTLTMTSRQWLCHGSGRSLRRSITPSGAVNTSTPRSWK